MKLTLAEAKIKSFNEKWKHQTQAIQTAKSELHRLERELAAHDAWKIEKERLMQELHEEQQKTKLLQEQLKRQQFGFLDACQVRQSKYTHY